MENIGDALKLAFALFVFMLAFTLLFQAVGTARRTAEVLIAEADKTTYYTSLPEGVDELYTDANGVVTRIVTLEEMIPTIYRYSIESYGVTLIDRNNQIITRFDSDTEGLCNNINRPNLSQDSKQKLIDDMNYYVLDPVGVPRINNMDELRTLFARIYGQNLNNAATIEYECPWAGNTRTQFIPQRIDGDLYGETVYFDIDHLGSQATDRNNSKNHIPCLGDGRGLIEEYKNSRFKEYIITHDKNSPTFGPDGDIFYIGANAGTIAETVKREIIYVEMEP